jgi:hypothetical protein
MASSIQPYISPDAIQSALNAIYSDRRTPQFESLLILCCVDQYLANANIPHASFDREYALKAILLDIINEQYTQLRAACKMPPVVGSSITRDDIKTIIVEDDRQDNRYLRALSVLYARFCIPTLDIDVSDISRWLGATDRTVRRYYNTGYDIVSEHLFQREIQANRSRHLKRLRASLPGLSTQILDRDTELAHLTHFYRTHSGGLVLINGDVGIGKTHLITHFCWHMLDDPRHAPDHMIWIHEPASITDVTNALSNSFNRLSGSLSLHDYMMSNDIVIVIDRSDGILTSLPNQLSWVTERVFLILMARSSYTRPLLNIASVFIHLESISPEASHQLYVDVRRSDLGAESALSFNEIQEHAQGNPGRIKLLLRSSSSADIDFDSLENRSEILILSLIQSNPSLALEITLQSLFHQYPNSVLPRIPIPPEVQAEVRDWITDDHQHLIRWVCTSPNGFALREQIIQFLLTLQYIPANIKTDIYETVIQKLLPDDHHRIDLLLHNNSWQGAYAVNRITTWHRLANETYLAHDRQVLELLPPLLEYHSYQNHQTRFEQLSQEGLTKTGETGNFSLQVQILYYIARNHYRRSEFVAALRLLNRLLANPNATADMTDEIHRETTKIYIALRQSVPARQHLKYLPKSDWRTALLTCEILYLEQALDMCVDHCDRLLNNADIRNYSVYIGYLHALKAQALTKQIQAPDSLISQNEIIDQFSLALYELSQTTQDNLIARVTNNFAVFLLSLNESDKAQHLLNWAFHQQIQQHDKLGQIYTEHNLSLL